MLLTHRHLRGMIYSAAIAITINTEASAALLGVSTNGNTYSINTTTGAATLLGTNSGSSFHGVSRNSAGIYYAQDWGNAFQFLSLTQINPTTGQKGPDIGAGTVLVQDMAFSPSDVLYSLGDDSGPDTLRTIDVTTGAATDISRLNAYSGGMAFVGGTLYASGAGNGLVTIDLTTGAQTDVNGSVAGGWTGMTYDSGVLYGTDGSNLYSINTTTGVQTLIGNTGASGLHGLAPSLPEPASLGLLAIGGIAALRRRAR